MMLAAPARACARDGGDRPRTTTQARGVGLGVCRVDRGDPRSRVRSSPARNSTQSCRGPSLVGDGPSEAGHGAGRALPMPSSTASRNSPRSAPRPENAGVHRGVLAGGTADSVHQREGCVEPAVLGHTQCAVPLADRCSRVLTTRSADRPGLAGGLRRALRGEQPSRVCIDAGPVEEAERDTADADGSFCDRG